LILANLQKKIQIVSSGGEILQKNNYSSKRKSPVLEPWKRKYVGPTFYFLFIHFFIIFFARGIPFSLYREHILKKRIGLIGIFINRSSTILESFKTIWTCLLVFKFLSRY